MRSARASPFSPRFQQRSPRALPCRKHQQGVCASKPFARRSLNQLCGQCRVGRTPRPSGTLPRLNAASVPLGQRPPQLTPPSFRRVARLMPAADLRIDVGTASHADSPMDRRILASITAEPRFRAQKALIVNHILEPLSVPATQPGTGRGKMRVLHGSQRGGRQDYLVGHLACGAAGRRRSVVLSTRSQRACRLWNDARPTCRFRADHGGAGADSKC